MAQDRFDIDCLRTITADPDSAGLALSAALIKMHALAIARAAPELRDRALEIARRSRDLHAAQPTRRSIAALVEAHLGTPGPSAPPQGRRRALADALWEHVRTGQPVPAAPSEGGRSLTQV